MHGHRTAPVAPAAGTLANQAQRLVLLEVVVDPPARGDRLADLPRRLDLPAFAIHDAVAALERAGLVDRHGALIRASAAALYFEALWPVAL